MNLNPYIKPKRGNTSMVMLDVVIALLPLVVAGYLAYGMHALTLIAVSILTALVTELIFSSLYLKNYRAIFDGSAVVTALLLVFTLSPATPWYMVSFGAAAAIIFGKIVWGGLGKNRFNPALVGREFMTTFFPAVMTSAAIWDTKNIINVEATNLFPGIDSPYVSSYLSGLFYKTTGALGEYSILLIVLGGLYLLVRKRISWHIPLALLAVFFAAFWFVEDGDDLHFSIAGVLLGTIYMATDMPSSPTNPYGKLYYGAMIGLVTFILILGGVSYEYMSFSILILNGFSRKISETFAPRVWGQSLNWKDRTEKVLMLSLSVLVVALAVISLHYYHFTQYLVYLYIAYIIIKFNYSFIKKISNPI
ncbi:RnfABCDGE type electron transport complex subunit D [Fulvivirga maritima]|uniref:RnfABCDGE type electron transport complex subunit D n=1 Tax=Fulvivirga maritima TaxID=2904247 RepID=UPI001F24483B|nr:RnfABCDGE type electron transport complex subunit D [Fulvivirga maritima]UII25958.1 RnfABCDGE type electron transport complex subunit D [Fulvivirga maritima]